MRIPTKPSGGTRPSLAGRVQPDQRRILASLEHGVADLAQAPRSHLRLATVSAAFLAGLAGALWWLSIASQAPQRTAEHLPAAPAAPGRAMPVAPPEPMAEAAMAGPAAAIIDEPLALARPRSADSSGRQHLDSAPSAAPAIKQAAPSTSLPAGPRLAAPARRPAAPVRDQPARKSPRAAGPPAYDSDVALLTALVAHANNKSAPSLTKVAAPGAANRDLVQARESETTGSLLGHCKQLGFIEGMLCRSRICSGRPAGDAACDK